MYKTNLKSFAALCSLCLLLSCKKENDSKSRAELLTQQSWQFSKYESKTNNDPWIDAYPVMQNCIKDNRFTYTANFSYIFDEGLTKCNAGDPQTNTFSWSFTAGESSLILNGTTYSIEQLDDSTLVLASQSVIGVNTYFTRATYKH